jgi:hypothetical protein
MSACPKNEEGRTGADAQTDANETDRHKQDRQTQTEVRQDDNVRSRRTSKDTDKTTTEQQRSQFAVVEDEATKQLIVGNPTATPESNQTMPADDIDDSPMTVTRTWEEVFRRLNQWDVVNKLRALHMKSSDRTSSTARRVRLFHHFHHNADDGLNDGTDDLWALMGSGAMATAMSVNKVHVNEPQRGTPFDWPKMLAWNSTNCETLPS